MLLRRSFATDMTCAPDDDYSLFADTNKCHDHLAMDVPTTELDQDLNNDNHMVNMVVVKFECFSLWMLVCLDYLIIILSLLVNCMG